MPEYEVSARYETDIDAPIETVYQAARYLEMGETPIVRWLYRLRGLPNYSLNLDGMLKSGFVLLVDNPCQEIVFGLIGRFWSLTAGIRPISANDFPSFKQAGFAKAIGNLTFTQRENGRVHVTTETRVHCTDRQSLRYFRLYWALIGPFSGIIRKEWLRLIRQRAEGKK
ncbi:MAG: hypothetical protein HZB19_06195 [Chloroflexi bacterium]|nr:hypothetical protein [Chloroflexota bacterium]